MQSFSQIFLFAFAYSTIFITNRRNCIKIIIYYPIHAKDISLFSHFVILFAFQVRTEDGLGLAEYWSCPFTECSAKSAHNVNTVFAEIVREMNYVQNARIKQNQGCCIVL